MRTTHRARGAERAGGRGREPSRACATSHAGSGTTPAGTFSLSLELKSMSSSELMIFKFKTLKFQSLKVNRFRLGKVLGNTHL